MKIRIKFKKYGAMKFIGHLDVMRYFQKAIRRSEVDIRYSEGFSPHQIMSFASPLGVGITSNGEYVDIEVLSTQDSKTMVNRMNAVMTEGFEIVSYRQLPDTAANAMSSVAAADYTIRLRPGYETEGESRESHLNAMFHFLENPCIMVTKQTKKGENLLDIKPLIYEMRLDGGALFVKLSAGSAANIKPELALDAYYNSIQKERPPFAYLIQREEVYADQASEVQREKGVHQFVTLESLGQEIEEWTS